MKIVIGVCCTVLLLFGFDSCRNRDPVADSLVALERRHPEVADFQIESGERIDRQRKDAKSAFGVEVPAVHSQGYRRDIGVIDEKFRAEIMTRISNLGWILGDGSNPYVMCAVRRNSIGSFDYVEVAFKTPTARSFEADARIRIAELDDADACSDGIIGS